MKTPSIPALAACLFLFTAMSAQGGPLPDPPDSWSEYPDAEAAQADGWVRECALSQAITVADDCATGASSVGCRAVQARWCNEFGLEKAVPLAGVNGLRFRHKGDWSGWNFQVRLSMQPTGAEAAAGVEVKRLTWNFPAATVWTENEFPLAEGEWSWRVDDSWVNSGYEETLTEMVGIKWFFCTYWGVAVGDRLLIDDLELIRDVSDVPADTQRAQPLVLTGARPNPCNPGTELAFHLQGGGTLHLVVHDLAGRRVRLGPGVFYPAGTHAAFWDGRDDGGRLLPAGIYFLGLQGDGLARARKVVLVP